MLWEDLLHGLNWDFSNLKKIRLKRETVNEGQKEFYSNFKQNKAIKAWYAERN